MCATESISKLKVVQKVNKIVTHHEPHADEFLAIYLLRSYGQAKFPGIADAKIITKDGSVKLVSRKDWLKVGIGEGIFDEHGLDAKKECCCADLVAQYLGIDQIPKVKLLLKKIRMGDLYGKSTTLDLGQCVKTLNQESWPVAKIEKWLTVFLDCYFDDKTVIKGFSQGDDQVEIIFPISDQQTRDIITTNTFYHKWLKSIELNNNSPEVKKLAQNLQSFSKQPPSILFNFCEGVCLIATHLGMLEAYSWSVPIFEASKNFQLKFLEACDIIKTVKPTFVRPDDENSPNKFIQILEIDRRINQSGNECLLNAARFLNKNLDILVVQQPTGNVQIFIPQKRRQYLWPMLVRAIRLEEMIANDTAIDEICTDYDQLAQTGNVSEIPQEIPQWYFPANGNGVGWALLNGSLTMPKVKPSNIFFDKIIYIIKKVVLLNDCQENWQDYLSVRLDKYRDSCKQQSNSNCLGDIAKIRSLNPAN